MIGKRLRQEQTSVRQNPDARTDNRAFDAAAIDDHFTRRAANGGANDRAFHIAVTACRQ